MSSIASCDPLSHLASNVCGNHIIEPGEDCDGAGIGASTCSSACRLECATSAGDPACPPGWGCGNDGICRQPDGAFTTLGSGLAISADRLTLADFDGDGRRDVLATRGTSLSIAFLDQHGLLPETITLSLSPVDTYVDAPGVGQLDATKRADLALRIGDDLGVLRGQQDRTLLADTFTRDPGLALMPGDVVLSMDIDVRPDAPGDELVAVGNGSLRVVRTLGEMPSGALFTWSGKQLAGLPFLSAENQLVLAFQGDPSVQIYTPLVSDPTAKTQPIPIVWNVAAAITPNTTINLPSGAAVSGGAFLFPLRSGGLDLLIDGTLNGNHQEFVSFFSNQFGDGYYSSSPTAATCTCDDCGCVSYTGPTGATLQCCGAACCSVSEIDVQTQCCEGNAATLLTFSQTSPGTAAPLTSGTSANLGTTLVTPTGIFTPACINGSQEIEEDCLTPTDTATPPDLSKGYTLPLGLVAGPPAGAAWTSAKILGDDIVTTSAAPGLVYYRGESGELNPFQVPTQSPVTNLVTGDFNGDGVEDLMFTQVSSRAPISDPTFQSLQVSFGDPYGLPSGPTDLGDVGHVSWLLSEVDLSTGSGVSNGIAQEVPAAPTATPDYYVFNGSTDRQLQSPFVLLGEGSSSCDGAPVGVARYSAIGSFSGAATADIATLYRVGTQAPYSYVIHSVVPTSGDSKALCTASIGSSALPSPGADEFTLLPIDLNGDGKQELLIFPVGGSQLFLATVASSAWTVQSIPLGAPYAGMTTADLGAGPKASAHLLDVVLWARNAQASATPGNVTVLWNDGTGSLSASSAAQIPIPASVCSGSDDRPNGVAALNLKAAPQNQLVIVTTSDTLVASIADPIARTFGPLSCETAAFDGGGDALATGDVNGDGVDDFVVSRLGGIQVFTGIPVLP